MSDVPNPYRQLTSLPAPEVTVQEHTTSAVLHAPKGAVALLESTSRIELDAFGNRTITASTNRTPSLDGSVLDEKNAVACPKCRRAPFTSDEIGACETCGRRACKKHCLRKHATGWHCTACHRRAVLRRAFSWLTTR